MSDERPAFEKVDRLLTREETALHEYNRHHHIPSVFERSRDRSMKVLRGDSGDVNTAEGMAAGKLGIPVSWCPYPEEEGDYRRTNWLSGHHMGRVHLECHPPSMPVLERLAAMLESRIRKTDRDYEQHLLSALAHERELTGRLSSGVALAEKAVAQLEGRYGPDVKTPIFQLRVTVEEIVRAGKTAFRAVCHGIQGAKCVADTKEEAIQGSLHAALRAFESMVRDGREFRFEYEPDEETVPVGPETRPDFSMCAVPPTVPNASLTPTIAE